MFLLGRFFLLLFLTSCHHNHHKVKNDTISAALQEEISLEVWQAPETIIVIQDEDDWWKLEKNTGIPSIALKRFNNNMKLLAGKKLKIPAKKYHIVKSRETVLGISTKYGMKFSEITSLNNLNPPYKITIGLMLKVLDLTALKNNKIEYNMKFIWPIKGEIIENFGKQDNGRYNNEVVIKANGAVFASEAGKVVYVGNEVGSYINLIIIKHAGNFFSNYANLDEIYVQKGAFIKKGHKLGIVKDKLSFGIRSDMDPINPLKFLPKN